MSGRGDMDEAQWRQLAETALGRLAELGLDPAAEVLVRAEITAALRLPRGEAKAALRAALTGRPELRSWLRAETEASAEVRLGAPLTVSRQPAEPPRQELAFAPPAPRPMQYVGAAPPEPVPATRTVHARLDAPASVAAGVPFMLLVGVGAAPSPGVLSPSPFEVPNEPYTLTVSLMHDGFRTVDDSIAVLTMASSPQAPHPVGVIQLVAVDDPAYRDARQILAIYTIDGHTLGVATTAVTVVRAGEPPKVVRDEEPAPPPERWTVPTEGEPDLVITVARGNDQAGRALLWSAHSPHPQVTVPAAPFAQNLDETAAGDWARRVMRGVEQRRSSADLTEYLRGVQLLIGDQIPGQIWQALETAATVADHPAVLFVTDEPYVPWELARVPRPWDEDRPPLLGAQAHLGRWVYRQQGHEPAPAVAIDVTDIAVVKGVYAGSSRLPEAEAEADHLVGAYGALPVVAELRAVLDCIAGEPATDVLHFAVHGRVDATGVQDGILMNDKSPLSPESILGALTSRPRLAFLNACQVGQGQELLGNYAGVVPSFIRIGAQAVVAPLWKVDDVVARGFAERFYAGVFAGRPVAELLAEERSLAAVADPGSSPASTVLAYLFFGHPRLTIRRADHLEEAAHAAPGT